MKNQRGFSLLESVMAITILAVVLAQVVSIHANSLAASQSAINNVRATWAMRAALAQVEYVIDVYGSKEGLRSEVKQKWGADETMEIVVTSKASDIEASRLLMSAMRIGSALSGAKPTEGQEGDPADMIKGMASQLDSFVPKDIYKQVSIAVNWKQGETQRGFDSGLFLVDSKSLKLSIPNIPGMPGGDGAEAPSSSPTPTATKGR